MQPHALRTLWHVAAWLRREEEPDKSLTDARKELVHSYMDAEESETRRQAVERVERQARMREQARLAAAEEAVRRQEERGDDEDDVARRVAAAAAEAREEARREAEEETARQVAAAVEQALREAEDETARQVAEAVAQARQEAVSAEPPQPREPRLEQPSSPVAAILDARAARREAAAAVEHEETTPGAEQPASHSSTEGLPLSQRIAAATRPDDAPAPLDWPHELLRSKKNARNPGSSGDGDEPGA